jgi:hypothetical protein
VSNEPIFRSIEVAEGLTLSLDAPIPSDVLPMLTQSGPDQYTMLPGTFGNAASIQIDVDPANGEIAEMEFTYTEMSYETLLTDYTENLGAPTSSSDTPGDQSATWDDGVTSFELYDTNGEVGSILQDSPSAAK